MRDIRNKIYLFLIFTLFTNTTDAFGMMNGARRPSSSSLEGAPPMGQRISRGYRPPVDPVPQSRGGQRQPSPLVTVPTLYDPKRGMYYFEKFTEEDTARAQLPTGEFTPQKKVELLQLAEAKLERQLQEQRTLATSASSEEYRKAYLNNTNALEVSLSEARTKLEEQRAML